MKKAFLIWLIIILLVSGGTISGLIYQKQNNQNMLQAIADWKDKLSAARLEGKSPNEISVYLGHLRISHENYSGLINIGNGPEMGQQEGYLRADAGPVAQTLSVTGIQEWHIQMMFMFNTKNRCKGCSVWAAGDTAKLME